jgi:hypothetical protein
LVFNIFSPGNQCRQVVLEATQAKLSGRRAINSRVVSDSRNENSICATSQETQQEKDKIVIIHSRSECTYVRALLHNQHYYIHQQLFFLRALQASIIIPPPPRRSFVLLG